MTEEQTDEPSEIDALDALKLVVAYLEPLYYVCPDPDCHRCRGCGFEVTEALTQAMNFIAGLHPYAHWGPARRPGEPKPEGYDAARAEAKAVRLAAWRAAGFVEDVQDGHTIWRRGTALD